MPLTRQARTLRRDRNYSLSTTPRSRNRSPLSTIGRVSSLQLLADAADCVAFADWSGPEPSLPHISRHDRRANNTRKFIRIDWAPVQTRCTLLLPGCVSAREEMFRWKSLPPQNPNAPMQAYPACAAGPTPSSDEFTASISHKVDRSAATRSVIAQTSPDRVHSVRSLRVNVASPTDFAIVELFRGSSGHGMTEPLEEWNLMQPACTWTG